MTSTSDFSSCASCDIWWRWSEWPTWFYHMLYFRSCRDQHLGQNITITYAATDQSPSTTTCCNLYQRTQGLFFYKEQQNLDKINRKNNLDRERDIVKKTIWVFHRHGGKFPWNPVIVFSLFPWNQLERESNPTQTTRTTSCHWNQRIQSFFLQKVTKSWNRILIKKSTQTSWTGGGGGDLHQVV